MSVGLRSSGLTRLTNPTKMLPRRPDHCACQCPTLQDICIFPGVHFAPQAVVRGLHSSLIPLLLSARKHLGPSVDPFNASSLLLLRVETVLDDWAPLRLIDFAIASKLFRTRVPAPTPRTPHRRNSHRTNAKHPVTSKPAQHSAECASPARG
jgi:hypothetical protein